MKIDTLKGISVATGYVLFLIENPDYFIKSSNNKQSSISTLSGTLARQLAPFGICLASGI